MVEQSRELSFSDSEVVGWLSERSSILSRERKERTGVLPLTHERIRNLQEEGELLR